MDEERRVTRNNVMRRPTTQQDNYKQDKNIFDQPTEIYQSGTAIVSLDRPHLRNGEKRRKEV